MYQKLTNYFGEINSFVPLKQVLKCFLISISGLLLIYYFSIFAGDLYQTSTPKGVIFATDNDGGRTVETSIKTRWYNSNHFAPYGNIYYRFSQTLADVIKLPQDGLSENEAKEKSHHFALRIVSLVCFIGIGLWLGWIIFKDSLMMILFSLGFCILIGKNPIWMEFISRPHPDHLLLLTIAVASYYTAIYYTNEKDKKYFIISAMWWGTAMAVKRSVSLYVPGIFILLLFPWHKDNIKKSLSYIGYMLLPYLILGFPQNFSFYKHIKFLLYESHNHRLATLDSFKWNLELTVEQLGLISLLILGSSFFSSIKSRFFSWKFLIFILISLVPILGRKMISQGHHHTLPIVTTIIVLICILCLQFNKLRILKFNSISYFTLIIVLLSFNSPITEGYRGPQRNHLRCMTQVNAIRELLKNNVNQDNKFVKEPYFPFSSDAGKSVLSYWGLSWDFIDSKTTYFGIRKETSELYRFPAPDTIHKDLQVGWDSKIKFYQSIWDKSEALSPDGSIFKKIYEDDCGYQLWKVQK